MLTTSTLLWHNFWSFNWLCVRIWSVYEKIMCLNYSLYFYWKKKKITNHLASYDGLFLKFMCKFVKNSNWSTSTTEFSKNQYSTVFEFWKFKLNCNRTFSIKLDCSLSFFNKFLVYFFICFCFGFVQYLRWKCIKFLVLITIGDYSYNYNCRLLYCSNISQL